MENKDECNEPELLVLEKQIIGLLIKNKDCLRRFAGWNIKPSEFQDKFCAKIVLMILDYWNEYKDMFCESELLNYLDAAYSIKKIDDAEHCTYWAIYEDCMNLVTESSQLTRIVKDWQEIIYANKLRDMVKGDLPLLETNQSAAIVTKWARQLKQFNVKLSRTNNTSNEVFSIDQILDYGKDGFNDILIGSGRWIYPGSSTILVGQSGIGKSSLTTQLIIGWALGLSVFGIPVVKPLKSIYIQAENDLGDLYSQFAGTIKGFDLEPEQIKLIKDNIIVVRQSSLVGEQFTDYVRDLIDSHKPDLVWVDPLLSYLGDDINQQSAVSKFLRNQLQPILNDTNVAMILIHHTGKPSKSTTEKKHVTDYDLSYIGLGSSEITNWARNIMYLHQNGDKQSFSLRFTKHGRLALNGEDSIKLRQSNDYVFWNLYGQEIKPNLVNGKPVYISMSDVDFELESKRMIELGMNSKIKLYKYFTDAFGMSKSTFYKKIGKFLKDNQDINSKFIVESVSDLKTGISNDLDELLG